MSVEIYPYQSYEPHFNTVDELRRSNKDYLPSQIFIHPTEGEYGIDLIDMAFNKGTIIAVETGNALYVQNTNYLNMLVHGKGTGFWAVANPCEQSTHISFCFTDQHTGILPVDWTFYHLDNPSDLKKNISFNYSGNNPALSHTVLGVSVEESFVDIVNLVKREKSTDLIFSIVRTDNVQTKASTFAHIMKVKDELLAAAKDYTLNEPEAGDVMDHDRGDIKTWQSLRETLEAMERHMQDKEVAAFIQKPETAFTRDGVRIDKLNLE